MECGCACSGCYICQVREGDVLRQKAYMLFYVREGARGTIMHKDNGVASLSSNKKMIPEKIVFMDGAICNGLVDSAMKVSSFAGEDAKLQKQNQPSNFCDISRNQCSKAHNNVEVTDTSTSQNNVAASVQKTPVQGQCSSAHKKTEVTDASTSQNNVPASVQETNSQNLFLHVHNKTEVIGASTSHNNEADSVQNAPFTNPNGAATVSAITKQINSDSQSEKNLNGAVTVSIMTKQINPDSQSEMNPNGAGTVFTITKQINSDSQSETMPPGQHDICILHAASCDQKACKGPLQELELKSDDSLTDLGKYVADATHPICNGADGLLGANEQANKPQPGPFCESIPDNNTQAIAHIIPTEDTAVLNQSASKSTSGNVAEESEPIKQHDELVAVKELSPNGIDDKENKEGQTFVLDQAGQEGQLMVKELSGMDVDHVADAEEQACVQNHSLDSGQVSSKKICSEASSQIACAEDCAQVMCSEDSLPVLNKEPCHGKSHGDMTVTSKKHLKYPVVKLFFGSKQLLLGSLKPRKKWKHKRIKRRLRSSIDAESIASDQQTSTSETAHTEGTSFKSRRRKRSRSAASSDDDIQFRNNKQQQQQNSIAHPDSGKCAPRNDRGSSHFDLLTRGLRQITVPRWDDIDMPHTTETGLQQSISTSIGYVLDEQDEEYYRGKRKKVKRRIKDFTGPNPFQGTANIRSWRTRRL